MKTFLVILVALFIDLGTSYKTLECVNGEWQNPTSDTLPHINCARNPVCIRWSALNEQRCRSWKLDSDWPTTDNHIRRHLNWHGAGTLLNKLRNKTVWIIGDSITNLFWAGLKCEIWRHGAHLSSNSRVEQTVRSIPEEQWAGGKPFEYFHADDTNTDFIFKGWHKVFKEDWELMVQHGDVFIFNYGLHYNNMTEYQHDMNWLLNFLQTNKKISIFREISAQHFAKAAYNKDVQKADDGNMVCGATEPKAMFENFVYSQNQAVETMINSEYQDIKILRFYNLTSIRSDLLESRFCELESRRQNPQATCLDW